MMRLLLVLTGTLLLCATVSAQESRAFQQRTQALLAQDRRVAAYEMNAERGTPQNMRFTGGYTTAESSRVLQTYFTSRTGVDAYTAAKGTELYGDITVVRYQQYFKGLKVEFGEVVMVSRANTLSYLTAENYIAEAGKSVTPTLPEAGALNKAIGTTNAARYAWQDNTMKKGEGGDYPKGELVLMPDMRPGKTGMVLAWKFDIYATQPLSRNHVYISAEDGSLIFRNAIIKHANEPGTAATRYSGTKTITTNKVSATQYQLKETSTFMDGIETYNMNRGTSYTNATIPTDNDNNWSAAEYNNANKDQSLLDAHWGAEQVVAYWKTIHNRNSYDNRGAKIKSYVHYSTAFDNAYWDGSQMTYGDGSGGANGFLPLTSLDVVAHEIGHAVCEKTSNLVYSGESGGMNEGFSDIWGACLDNYADPTGTVYNPFLVGEQIAGSGLGGFLRNMANPPADGLSPDTYSSAVNGMDVHYSSGILNKWFYLITKGEAGTNDLGNAYNVTGLGFAKAQQIAFLTELSLTANAKYAAARTAAIGAATSLYGPCVPEVQTVINAWYAVGVGPAYNPNNCGTKIQFLSSGARVSEGVASTACHPGKEVKGAIVLLAPIATNAVVTLNDAGTARLGRDYTIDSTLFTFVPGGPLQRTFTITLYDNNTDEGDRTLLLTYTVTGGATAGTENQSYALTIIDDDAAPYVSSQSTVSYTTISESFTGLSALPNGWSTFSNLLPAGGNIWTVGNNAGTISSGAAAYITNNGSTKPWSYIKNSVSDVILVLPELDAANLTNMRLNFKYIANGEKIATTAYDYGSLVYSLDGGTTFVAYPNISFSKTTTSTAFSLDLPDNIFSNKRFRIGFRWRNDDRDGTDPPFGIDDVSIQVTRNLTNVETALYAGKDEYVDAANPVYFLSAANKKIIARIINSSTEARCVNATLTGAGNGQGTLTYGSLQYKRSSKVVTFTPSTPDNTITHRLRLYYSADELAVWGNQKYNLKMVMVRNGVDVNGTLTASDIQIVTPILAEEQSGVAYYEGDFTGWGQVMLISPTSSGVACSSFTTTNNTLYVDGSVAESGIGTSWGSPMKTLNEALRTANNCPAVQQILVAKGTYYPTTDGSRDSSFRIMRNGIKLYGGYPTGGGVRNLAVNTTTLSGNIGSGTAGDNSYHILTIMAGADNQIDTTTRVDGFTFTGGTANSFTPFYVHGTTEIWNDNGGAIYNYGQSANNSCKPLIVSCVFTDNRANNRGGAVFNEGFDGGASSPMIMNSVFYNNQAGFAIGSGGNYGGGGAVFNNGPSGTSRSSIYHCTFYGNKAYNGVGGAIANDGVSSSYVVSSIIYQNTNNSGTDDVANTNGGSLTIHQSLLAGVNSGFENISGDPLFVNPTSGDLRLQGCSPAINKGGTGQMPSNITTDVAGNPRQFNAAVDMGAYENVTLPTTFTFTGSGNWTVISNWQCNWVPPAQLPSGSEVVIDPTNGDCIMNLPYTLPNGVKLTIKAGKKLIQR